MITVAAKSRFAPLFEDKLWVHAFTRIGHVTSIQVRQVFHTFPTFLLVGRGRGALCRHCLLLKVFTTHRIDYKVPISQSLVLFAIMRGNVHNFQVFFIFLTFLTFDPGAFWSGGLLYVKAELSG